MVQPYLPKEIHFPKVNLKIGILEIISFFYTSYLKSVIVNDMTQQGRLLYNKKLEIQKSEELHLHQEAFSDSIYLSELFVLK